MVIGGLQKTSCIDFPGKISCVLFLSGCNFECPYCHNPQLTGDPARHRPCVAPEEVFEFLEQRRGRLDGVVVSGGEPTLHPDLPELCRRIQALGYPVKLDTNGSRPEMLASLLADRLVDYVAMDIKADPAQYGPGGPFRCEARTLASSVGAILQSGVDHEFRTTCVRPIVSADAVVRIAQLIHGCRRYVLQPYRAGNVLHPGFFDGEPGLTVDQTAELARIAERWVECCLR